MSKLTKTSNSKKTRFLSKIPFFKNSSKNDDNIDRTNKRKQTSSAVSNESIDEEFQFLLRNLREFVIGQETYTEGLCKAFERPFLIDNGKSYANLTFVFGKRGSGRYYAIKVLSILMKQKKMLKTADIYNLDYRNYDTEDNTQRLLLPDLYKAFYGKSEVVVINNFDQGCRQAQDMIVSLVENGSIKPDKRFNWNKGDIQEVSGTYSLGTMNSLSANSKYIFVLSEKDSTYLANNFQRTFITEIQDILVTNSLKKDDLAEIGDSFFSELKDTLFNSFRISLLLEFKMIDLLDGADTTFEAESLDRLINKKIYNCIGNLILNAKLTSNSEVHLRFSEGTLFANDHYLLDFGHVIDEEAVTNVKKELMSIVGLKEVKEFLEDIEFQIRSDIKNGTNTEISKHMIFLGNPGTGKTTIARIVAKWFKALGFLTSGHLIETSRSDFVGQYVGETAQKTMSVLKRATGGILFIDEAYALSHGKGDSFGLEAVDTIVKYMEDNRTDLIVILAGYTNEMSDFLKSNSGLKSRFNYSVEFKDYSEEELYEISIRVAAQKGFSLADNCYKPLTEYFALQKKILKNESGNGRMARNLIEKAIVKRARHIAQNSEQDDHILRLDDFEINDDSINEQEITEARNQLKNIIGQEEVKQFIQKIEAQIRYEKKTNKHNSVSKHMIFLGNPGTGKTTIARIVALYLKGLGFLSKGQFIEADRSHMVGQYLGETAQKTTALINKAIGGVLFIDEAYAIVRTKNDQFGLEAVDTLVKAIEDYRDNLVVILAGYTDEMNDFLESNSGLKSRFNHKILFKDYSAQELLAITERIVSASEYRIQPEVSLELLKYYERKQKESAKDNGNGRMVRNIVEKAIIKHADRIMSSAFASGEENVLKLEDFEMLTSTTIKPQFDLEGELNKVIGMNNVKDFIRSLYSLVNLSESRRKMGLTADMAQSLHMIFMGNPGTGKTTMARILAKMFYSMGLLNSDKVIETDRAGLVAGYVGQTAIKTKRVIETALDGVLFIDEAYSLASSESANDFGKEAIDTLVKDMDDYRDRLIVILAGYKEDMIDFLKINPGLQSRFPNILEFSDYSSMELVAISKQILERKGFVLTKDAEDKMNEIFDSALKQSDFGNGRYARNICEQAIRNMSVRVGQSEKMTRELLSTITKDDIERCV